MLKKHFSAFHLNQAPNSLCSPFPTETLDVQLQVCRIQRHSTLFVHPIPVPPAVRIDNIWVRLFLCSVGIWHNRKMSSLPAPLALKGGKSAPSPTEEQIPVAAEHSGLCLLRVWVSSFTPRVTELTDKDVPMTKLILLSLLVLPRTEGFWTNCWYDI